MRLFKKNKDNRTVRPVIFVVDTSATMDEELLGRVNAALKAVMEKFAAYNRKQSKDCVKVAILAGASKWKWVTRGLADPVSREIFAGKGELILGDGLSELDRKLSPKGLFSGNSVCSNTVICFLTAGAPTDDYADALAVLNRNYWYVGAKKTAVGIGKSSSAHVLGRLTGNPETVRCIPHGERLEKTLLEFCETVLHSAAGISAGWQPTKPTAPPPMACMSLSMSAPYESVETVLACSDPMEQTGGLPDLSGFLEPEQTGPVVYCKTCGGRIRSGSKFCHMCGSPIPQVRQEKVKVSQVQFSAIIPGRCMKGEYTMLDIAVYEELYREIVDRAIANAGTEVREVMGSPQTVQENTEIKIRLSSPDLEIKGCEETQIWRGKYLLYSFPVEIPADYGKNQILFIATVYFNDVIATSLKILARCTAESAQKIQLVREDILSAFISYASQDRGQVATVIQGMKIARPELDVFFDVENLRSGEEWEKTLRREIENRDVLYLCWSNHAKASEWVEKEWRYALEKKGLQGIEPIPLVFPTECPPPEELKSKHFNDKALLYRSF